MDSLYNAIGGLPALEVAVQEFCQRVRTDREVAPLFEGMDIHKQKSRLMACLGQAVGAPIRYSGPPARRDQAHVRLEQRHRDAVAGHLAASLRELGIGDELVASIIERVRPFAAQIVETGAVRAAAA